MTCSTLMRHRTSKSCRWTTAFLISFWACAPHGYGAPPQWREWDPQIDSLISRMTLAEKLGQLTLQWGGESEDGNPDVRRKSEEEVVSLIRTGQCGALLGVHGAAFSNRLQSVARNESPHRIPLLLGNDVVHGYHTIFPIPLAEACSWNPPLVEKAARVAAIEARASGTNWTFAPMVDVTRDPRWGRIAEGAGEDPYLGALLAAARVRGFQGQKLSDAGSVLACAKHFVAYGAPEGGRDYSGADISPQTLREILLPPFRSAVKAGVGSLMSAFNEINGIPATSNTATLTDLLRGEWSFNGLVVSDWTSVTEMVNHGYARDNADAAVKAIRAGVDLDMSSTSFRTHLAEAVRSGQVAPPVIDQAVRRVLRMKFALGLFEHPFVDPALEAKLLLCDEHRRIAREMARQSIVLLKNGNGILPIANDVTSIAVVGPLGDDRREALGTWAVIGKPNDVIPRLESSVVSLLGGLRDRATKGMKIRFARGCELDGEDKSGFDEAVGIARECDLIILAVGEGREMSGEAASRTSLQLPGVQQELVEAIHATGKPTVVVVQSGRPLTISWIADHVQAVVQAWHLGTETGHALADVLFGDFNPCGRLTVTVPRYVGQVPIYYNHKNTGRPPTTQKYTSKYLDSPWTPLYPFGFGLSYTNFNYHQIRLKKTELSPSDNLEISVGISNTGNRRGTEVAQLYVRDVAASMTRPVRELKAFSRIELDPGERRDVEFVVPLDRLGFYDADVNYVVEPGTFKVWIGPDATSGPEAEFEIVRDRQRL